MAFHSSEIIEKMASYAGELQQLAKQSADKQMLLNGDGKRHGLNHLNELWNMLPEGDSSKEFKIRE